MLNKVIAVYKGDVVTALIYAGVGAFLLLTGIILYLVVDKIGFHYLSLGFILFGILSLGKGFLLYRIGIDRRSYYSRYSSITNQQLQDEYEYTRFRLEKKAKNRRRYIWTVLLTCTMAMAGIFMKEKGLVLGTTIPIALFAGIEFCIGLLVEFRLWEYYRQMSKELGIPFE